MSKSLGSTAAGLVAILFGFLGTIIGNDNLRLALQSSPKPQEISCADLCANGPGKNAHVTLTDFTPLWDDFTVDMTGTGAWSQVHIPLAPKKGQEQPRRQDGYVLAIINGVRNYGQLETRLAGGEVTGLIEGRINYAPDLDLDEDNPKVETTACWQLVEGKKPGTVMSAANMAAGGVVLAGIGLFLLVWGRAGARDGQMHRSILFMSPLLAIIDVIAGAFQGSMGSSRRAALHLSVVGGGLTGLGGYLLVTDGLYSQTGFTFNLGLGSVMVDIGFGLLVLAGYYAVQAWFESAAAVVPAARPSPEQRRPLYSRLGGWLIGLGAGLFLAAGGWLAQGKPSVDVIAGLIGVGVTACLVGIVLMFAARSADVTSEEKGLGG